MRIEEAIYCLANYAICKGLIEPVDAVWAQNGIFQALELQGWSLDSTSNEDVSGCESMDLHGILETILDDAASCHLIGESVTERDLLDTKVMGTLTPRPSDVIKEFWDRYDLSPRSATDWFYAFNIAVNYIRADRIAHDIKWKAPTEYGDLDITINLSKPEKDPRDIAAARELPQTGYPVCLLCRQNEGYAGNIGHPARQNLRLVPLELDGDQWFFQYSPYVYYNEHCIVLDGRHVPMRIDESTFKKLLDFMGLFPEYMIGSNADLPIVGGSILSHDHFQGGRYEFPMAKAEIETPLEFVGFDDVYAGIVKWPMSVIRLRSENDTHLVELASKILEAWRGYTDEDAFVFAETEGAPHNTVTPIARMREGAFEIDLVLRNNIATKEHPLGVFHPHEELHHIKKENIGLIEVMGLAVLPARLKQELHVLADAILADEDVSENELIAKHAKWAERLKSKHVFNRCNIVSILRDEVGSVFLKVLEDAGVFKRDSHGKEAFLRFVEHVNNL